MLARSGLVGNNPPGPISDDFSIGRRNAKEYVFLANFPWWANGCYSTALGMFFVVFRPTQKIAWDGPKWGREVIFPANPDLANILGRTDFDFEESDV